MVDFNPVEGIDYIFDRYAFLGITPDADIPDIEKAIKAKRTANHPDNFVRAEDEERKNAQHKFVLAGEIEDFLLNPDIKPIYDEKLKWFRDHHPELISNDGRSIINLGSTRIRVDLDRMLGDTPVIQAGIEKYIVDQTGHSENGLARKRRLFQRDPDDTDLRDEYVDGLLRKLTYITVMEQEAWQRAGVDGVLRHNVLDMQEPSDHVALVGQQIAHVRDEMIPSNTAQRGQMIMLGMAKPPLLLQGTVDEPAGTMMPFQPQELIVQAQTNFEQRSRDIVHWAEQKVAVLDEIMPLLPTEYLTPTRHTGTAVIHLLQAAEDQAPATVISSFCVNEQEQTLYDISSKFNGLTLEQLRQERLDHTHIAVTSHREIQDILLPVLYVAQTHGRILQNAPVQDRERTMGRDPGPEYDRRMTM